MECKILHKLLNELIGLNAWGAKIGHGSFLTIDFGMPVKKELIENEIGEWHLWVYLCSWRIEKNDLFVAGCEDSREKMTYAVKQINGSKLLSFTVSSTSLDAVLAFDNGLFLKLFSIYSEEKDSNHWLLYMPNNKVLVAGPGSKWEIEDTKKKNE